MKSSVIASFRDPSGFVFKQNGRVLRQVNNSYKENYDLLMSSGLYTRLIKDRYLIPHRELKQKHGKDAYKIIAPEKIPFISYSYEWCFSQLKDAALLTLKIQKTALEFGLSLKDATSFNVQFLEGKPILIDTLSFEKYQEGEPWTAYKQFCEQFLSPLALYCQVDTRLNGLLQSFVGNIPLDLTSKLLPKISKLNFSLLIHIVLHSRSQNKYAGRSIKQQKFSSFGKNSLSALIDSLESAISGLSLKESKTKWNNYYENNNYAQASFGQKEKLVGELLKETGAKFLWDIGANSGNFSRIAAKQGMFTLSLDNDLAVVEQNYRQIKRDNEHKILPLYQDITCPSPAIGWGNDERDSFLSRELPDCILALALIHHLAIGNNLPFSYVAGLFSKLAKHLIIEFVPKEDSQVQILLQQRLDIFPNYTQRGFEHEFEVFFTIKNRINIPGTKRTLYLMKTRGC